MTVQLEGPKGTATLRAEATRPGDRWVFDRLDVELHDEDRTIDLLQRGSP